MKKQLRVTIYKTGSESDVLVRLIGNYNEGKRQISVRDLEGYFATRNAMFPTITDLSLVKGDAPNEYHVSEDGGKTFTMSLQFVEVYELDESYQLPPKILDGTKMEKAGL